MTLFHMLTWIADLLHAHGARHAAVSAVSNHLGWVGTKHWMIRICLRGTKGCGF